MYLILTVKDQSNTSWNNYCRVLNGNSSISKLSMQLFQYRIIRSYLPILDSL